MKHYTYQPVGTCSQQIDFDIDDEGRIQNVQFLGGCNGNLQGISQLVRGIADTTALPAEEARKEMLEGLRNSTQLNVYKEAGYNFHYTYFSTKHPGQKIVDIKFTPKDYAQNAK